MAKIPPGYEGRELTKLILSRRGKVRNTWTLPKHRGKLLPFATDRISIFDFVLPALVRQKGAVLTAMNVFWRQFFSGIFEHDLVAFGAGIDEYLPEGLRGDPELQAVATVIRRCKMLPVEGVVRGYLTGSAVGPYLKEGIICGHRVPAGLHDGSELPYHLFTPTSKAKKGHDLHISADSVAEKYGFWLERLALQAYTMARQYAISRGIILVDTKLEVALRILADELFTPDSSRFWEYMAWVEAQRKGKLPPSFDKQFVREWGKSVGIDKLKDPDDPDQLAQVHSQAVPQEVLDMTTRIYRYIFWRLVGMKLEAFQKEKMGIAVQLPSVNVDVVLGSRSDLEKLHGSIHFHERLKAAGRFRLHIISCDRNPDELRRYAQDLSGTDVIVAGAGLAARLPGSLKSWLDHYGKSVPVIGVGFEGPSRDADDAARLSIEQLPGQTVELDDHGHAYFGWDGFVAAMKAALYNEFLPRRNAVKTAEPNIPIPTE